MHSGSGASAHAPEGGEAPAYGGKEPPPPSWDGRDPGTELATFEKNVRLWEFESELDAKKRGVRLLRNLTGAFAEKIGVPVEYVQYESADKLADDAKEDKWDVAMIGADPARAEFIDFTPPYCQIEATYAVPTTSGLRTCAEVDKAGVRIAGCDGAAYVLWLERNLKNATLEKIKGHDPTYEHFKENALDAVAGLRPKLKKDGAKRPGTRLLPGKFMAVEQAAATKKGREQGFKMLCEFIEEAKKSGKVKEFMQKFKVDKDLAIP